MELFSTILISLVAGIISGFIANKLYTKHLAKSRLSRIKNRLSNYIGNYEVFHWRNLTVPDECNYQINIEVEEITGIFKIIQKGRHNYDELIADVKIDELTFSYGEGIYFHPKKGKNECGKIKIFLVDDNTINVDKEYLDMKNESIFIPGAEKWQWRKKVTSFQ